MQQAQPEFIFPEGASKQRGRFELAFSQIGSSVMVSAETTDLGNVLRFEGKLFFRDLNSQKLLPCLYFPYSKKILIQNQFSDRCWYRRISWILQWHESHSISRTNRQTKENPTTKSRYETRLWNSKHAGHNSRYVLSFWRFAAVGKRRRRRWVKYSASWNSNRTFIQIDRWEEFFQNLNRKLKF